MPQLLGSILMRAEIAALGLAQHQGSPTQSHRHITPPAIVVRNIGVETHCALRARARRHGQSTEAEIRAILDGAVKPATRVRLGSALAALAQPLGGLELRTPSDKTPAAPADLG